MVQTIEKEKKPSCRDCRFAVERKSMEIGRWFAECRRFPPCMLLIQGSPVIAWPVVNGMPDLFCHEFKEK